MATTSTRKAATQTLDTTPEPAYASLSFVRRYKLPRQRYLRVDWFSPPDEEYGDGNITGYKAALEFFQFLKTNPDDQVIARDVIQAVARVFSDDHDLYAKDKRGATVTFLEGIVSAVQFMARRGNFDQFFADRIQEQLAYRADAAERLAKEKAYFVVRMKAARAAKVISHDFGTVTA